MLHRQFIFICLFVGVFAQRLRSNVDDSKDDKPNEIVQRRKPQPSQSSVLTTLANSEECKSDIQQYCGKGSRQRITNLKALECFDDLDDAVNLVSKECQNLIYKFKYNMTHDVRFDDAANRFCAKDIKFIDDCNEHKGQRGTGRLISCLYDSLANITESTCRNFIKRIQSVIFTDWRLSEAFTMACSKDIADLECGRLDDDNETLPHDQGAVISCLSESHDKVSKTCLKHISLLTKMQSDDFQLDRALYTACRDDRQRLCSQVESGNGRVYRCLYEQKFNSMMSAACRKEVHRRQAMVVTNVRLDAPLIRACIGEMRQHSCSVDPKEGDKQSSLVKLLLCLEDRLKKGEQINDECRREMLVHRRMLMSDYALSPQLVSECKTEMVQHCPSLYSKGVSGSIDQRGGRMIHCLLSAARKEKSFSPECLSAIKSLVRAVDPGNDIRADPLLETACRPVIDTLCPRIKPGDSNIILCLLDNLKNTRMTEECEDRLMEVAYFMARDWRSTPRLLITCRQSLMDLCQLPKDWTMNEKISGVTVGRYLSCLYAQKQQLDGECRSELKRLMRIRAQSIGLMPEIQDSCIDDLATCKNPEVKGEEMKCLQKKYDNLEEQCKSAVRNFTQITMSDPTLDFLLMKACEPMIQLFCPDTESGKENELIRCLIRYKNDQRMNFRCKAGIDHHQILSLQDKAFLSEQFKRKCSQEINEHCQDKKTKAVIIQCLANLVLKDVILKKDRITEECRDELKFELLQRGESITFDPLLAKACGKDISQFCSDQTAGNAQTIDCLKANANKVSPLCYARLKQRQRLDVVLPGNDFSLTSKCASVIQKYCSNEKKQNILVCLRRNANQDGIPNPCRRVLYQRLMVLNSDVRFNKGLIENCDFDIQKHCRNEIVDKDDDESDGDNDHSNDGPNNNQVQDRDMGGRVIECLRTKYANTKVELQPQCTTELIDVIQSSKLDIKLDVKLYQKCKNVLREKCPAMDKEDCLKLLYQKRQLTDKECTQEVVRIIKEGRADIHVDPGLFMACQADMLKYCNDIPIGSGKQLQCLLKISKSVTKSCRDELSKRKELWRDVPDIDSFEDLTRHIINSKNNKYLYTVIVLILFAIFIAGCICRPCFRSRRVRKYK